MEIENKNQYLSLETLGGICLLVAAILGMILANSPLQDYYENLINYPISISIKNFHLNKSVLFWINDGLVSLFFLLIGLEIKQELYEGELAGKAKLALPVSAAVGGVIVPALIYTLFNHNDPIHMRGWAIPTAIDTAFSLSLLALLATRVPRSLKYFLMSLTIIDDILAVSVIALFYADELSHLSILGSATIIGILVLLNQLHVQRLLPYLLLGILLWLFVLGSGVHTSIAGIILAFSIPLHKGHHQRSPLAVFKTALHPWVSFLILPIFAFANAGVPLETISLEQLFSPLSLGIALGLFLGKQLGIFGVSFILIKSKVAILPHGASWRQLYGTAVLCGIGFTMSLFIGALSFESGGPQYNNIVKLAVFTGSLLSAIMGSLILTVKRPTWLTFIPSIK